MSPRRRPAIQDEFTIPRPRWVVPLAIAGAVLLFLGIVVGTIINADDDTPEIRFTGGTTIVSTTVSPTTVSPTTVPPTTTAVR